MGEAGIFGADFGQDEVATMLSTNQSDRARSSKRIKNDPLFRA
jgi:hypothetical protein